MSYKIFSICGGKRWDVWLDPWGDLAASCPTREAAEAARRLLSGECARAKWPAAFFASVESALAKEEPPLPVCGVCSGGVCSEWCGYEAGKADGAAQERARIVAFAKTYVKSPIRADVLAEMIERGEAGE